MLVQPGQTSMAAASAAAWQARRAVKSGSLPLRPTASLPLMTSLGIPSQRVRYAIRHIPSRRPAVRYEFNGFARADEKLGFNACTRMTGFAKTIARLGLSRFVRLLRGIPACPVLACRRLP